MTCPEIARLAQLMINRGKWPLADGSVKQLIDEEYFSSMVSPSYPEINTMYGFLTWLNVGENWAPPNGVADPKCCFPRWGFGPSCRSANPWMDGFTNNSKLQEVTRLFGDGIPGATSKEEAWVAMGWLASHIMVLPERGLALVSMGNTWASSRFCHGKGVPGLGYDEGFALSVEHQILQNLVTSHSQPIEVSSRHSDHLTLVEQHGTTSLSDTPFRKKALESSSAVKSTNITKGASCLCSCWPIQGYGACIPVHSQHHLPIPVCKLHMHHRRVSEICPKVGSTADCGERGLRDCGFALETPIECEHVDDDCSREGSGTFRSKRCMCTQRWWQCDYSPKPCDPSDPYYPTLHDESDVDVVVV